jgi:hypothetical protein
MKKFFILLIVLLLAIMCSTTKHREIHLRSKIVKTHLEESIFQKHSFIDTIHSILYNSLSALVTINHQKEEIEKEKSYLFHFKPELIEKTIMELKKEKIKIGNYLPYNTYIITTIPSLAKKLMKEHSGILWIGDFHHHHKMPDKKIVKGHLHAHEEKLVNDNNRANYLFKKKAMFTRNLLTTLPEIKKENIHFVLLAQLAFHESKEEIEENLKPLKEELTKLFGKNIINFTIVSNQKIALGVLSKEVAYKVSKFLSKNPFIHWVETKPPTTTHNKYAAKLAQSYNQINGKLTTPMWDRGITGDGQVIGIGDTGCDHYHCLFYDEVNKVPFQTSLKGTTTSNHRKFAGFFQYMDNIDSGIYNF